jgi:ABC-type uncharacterized transport system YnjBCD permease subunit
MTLYSWASFLCLTCLVALLWGAPPFTRILAGVFWLLALLALAFARFG